MSLRFPTDLRARVKRYARTRGLEEATAVRTLCADRLRDLELREELQLAEHWQLEDALATWDRLDRGELKTHDVSEVRKVFAEGRRKLQAR